SPVGTDHALTVFTPSNGTFYFEELRVDADGDGEPDPEPVLQDVIESGGESAPLLFRIRYREPVVESLSPANAELDSFAFDDSKLPEPMPYNMTLQGSDFRDGAVVLFNGQARDTMYLGPGVLRVKLLPEDVGTLGTYPITVVNPGPEFQRSEPIQFEVTMPSRTLGSRGPGQRGGTSAGAGRVGRP
ncbi:MAG: hypothetical protein ACIARR_07620, partial [Phycisphaerales bacterium JB059]